MASVRFRKVARDLRQTAGRLIAAQLAIAVALAGVGTVLGTRAVLGPAIVASYASTSPADASLELREPIDRALLAELRARPELARADRRETVRARVRVGDAEPWSPLVVFVADDWRAATVATVAPERGAWPPTPGTLALERTSVAAIGAIGAPTVGVRIPGVADARVAVSGTVLDAGQAPAWQEHRATAYAEPSWLVAVGAVPDAEHALHELHVRFRPEPAARADAERAAAALAGTLAARGLHVDTIRVPPLRAHPHQGLMDAVQLVMVVFGFVLLGLAALVIATLLAAVLARSTREIAVMKAIGATSRQLAAMYAGFVLAIAAAGVAVALPLAHVGATSMIASIARAMNLADGDRAVPAWVPLAVIALGLGVPLLAAAVPIARAARMSVRAGLAHAGTRGDYARPSRWPLPIRNALRRPARLAFTLALLAAGGALVLVAADVRAGLAAVADKLAVARRFDLELRTRHPLVGPPPAIAGATAVEAWSFAEAALADGDAPATVKTYPDGGHGLFALVAPPARGSQLVAYPVLAGAWPTRDDEIALGHNARRGSRVGDVVAVDVRGRRSRFRVTAIVEEVGGTSGFVTPAAFAAATGGDGPRLVRIAGRAPGLLAAAETALEPLGIDYAMPAPRLYSIIDDHVALVVNAVLAVAGVLVVVGLIALASAMAIAVAERTRELAILRALGASDRQLARLVLGEALAIAAASVVLALALALPLTVVADAAVARSGFLAPPPFVVAWPALAAWTLAALGGAALATWIPTRRAIRIGVRAALADV